jgi:hypothetical protein
MGTSHLISTHVPFLVSLMWVFLAGSFMFSFACCTDFTIFHTHTHTDTECDKCARINQPYSATEGHDHWELCKHVCKVFHHHMCHLAELSHSHPVVVASFIRHFDQAL